MKLFVPFAIVLLLCACEPGQNSTSINGEQLSSIPTYTYDGR
ncbi:hypothetical protein SuNHUV7_14200 (plasmid) [Pseudoseohaeicola sp. NH-UV-7]|jgi:hypothetical protein|nr:hypothetical protein [Sulfitobacter sp. JL08]